MATIEEELKRRESLIKGASSLALLGKKIEIMGEENFVKGGPNIIVGNHIGTFKDIATLLKIIPRPSFFTANRMIFNRDEFNRLIRHHLKIHLKNFGLLLDFILSPLKSLAVNYISSNIAKVGTIPVDLSHGKRLAMEKCQEYLKKGKAIITLQGLGRVMKKNPNPYVGYFKRGASILSYNMYKEEGISVPVTPIAMLGTQVPFLVPAKIKVKIGEPMYITDYLAGEFAETVDRFRDALEKRVKALILDILFLGSKLQKA
ncbi:MAG: hypothetical protein GTO16_12790 [Candidatus Aminicenantes bacterium]|nr:hypothetical protein [Candidatus Aminicenantes bacterium]